MKQGKQPELPLSKKVLVLFEEAGRTFENPYRVVWERMNLSEPVSKRTIRTTIDRLKRNGKLERIEHGDKVIYRLTDGGRTEIRRYVFSKKKWDGKWRLVAFDIPEPRKRAREALRERLHELGFRQFQKSVWIGPYDVLDEIEEIREQYGVDRYVKLLTVEVVEDHDRLARRFGLSGGKEIEKGDKK